jgi:hypothetical protein
LSLAIACGLSGRAIPACDLILEDHHRFAAVIQRARGVCAAAAEMRVRELAARAARLVTERDFDVLDGELHLEMARAEARLIDLATRPPLRAKLGARPATGVASRPDPRGRYAYNLLRDSDLKLSAALNRFNSVAGKQDWHPVSSLNGLRHVARTYAERHRKPPPPPRHGV